MPYAKLDDNFPDHPKISGLSDRAFRIYISGLCYSARYMTDGIVPRNIALSMGSIKYINELIAADLWKREKIGYSVHDYLDYNISRTEWHIYKRQRSQAGKMGAEARWGDGSSDGSSHTKTDGSLSISGSRYGGGSPRGGNRFVHPLDQRLERRLAKRRDEP